MIRKACEKDLDQIMSIMTDIVKEMKESGNNQWDESYPTHESFYNDIKNDELYVKVEDDFILGFACINKEEANEYKELNWSDEKEALVIHRMGVNSKFRNKGVAKGIISFTEDLAKDKNINYVKVDTYSDNNKMNSLLVSRGYKFIGTVNFRNKEKCFNCYDKIMN